MITPNDEEEVNPMLMQLIMPMLPTYLMTIKGQLSLEVDDEAVNEIWDTVKEMMDNIP